jgi:DNA-binding transcriptional MerR regulator
MKKAVEQLKIICKDNKEAMELISEIDKWADAQFPIEEIETMIKAFDRSISKLSVTIKMNLSIVGFLSEFKDAFDLPDCVRLDEDALQEAKDELKNLEDKKRMYEKLGILYHIEQMTNGY